MCEPTTLALVSLVATGAGTAMQAAGAAKSRKAMEAVANAERQRQRTYQQEADALFAESLSKQGADQQTKGISDAEAARNAATQGAQQTAPVVSVPTQGATPTIVSDETAARVGVGNTQAAQDAAARSAMASFGDLQLGNALMNTRYGQKQGQVGRNMQGSASVLGIESEAASHKGDSLKGWGSGLTALGSVAGIGAGMGWGAAPAAAAPTYVAGTGMPLWKATSAAVSPQASWFKFTP